MMRYYSTPRASSEVTTIAGGNGAHSAGSSSVREIGGMVARRGNRVAGMDRHDQASAMPYLWGRQARLRARAWRRSGRRHRGSMMMAELLSLCRRLQWGT
ncbi:MAG TPA: hypothetical protein VKP13_17425, partial [Nitrospira sp.]|nr:hypothetical protein [Nitrospira sp.]